MWGKSKTYSRKGLMEKSDSTKEEIESTPSRPVGEKQTLTKRISSFWDQGVVPLDESTLKPKERVSATGLRENSTIRTPSNIHS